MFGDKYVSIFDRLTVFSVNHFYDVIENIEYEQLPDIIHVENILVINNLGGFHSLKHTIYYFDF